jgi:hypothetical protein
MAFEDARGHDADGARASDAGASTNVSKDAGRDDADGGAPDGPACGGKPRSTALPASAPVLTPGMWTDITPKSVPFGGAAAFTRGIELDPCDASTLYLAAMTNDGAKAPAGVYKTTDAGASWKRVGALDSPVRVRVDPRDPQHLYASDGDRPGTNGLWVSHDGGASWTMPDGFKQVATDVGTNDVYDVEPDPTDFDHVLVAFHGTWKSPANNAGILESFDGGNNWTVHPPQPEWVGAGGHRILFLYAPSLGKGDKSTWLYGAGSGYWRTTNAGAEWNKVSTAVVDHGGQRYYSKAGVLYVTGIPSIIRSIDNGATWTKVVDGSGFFAVIGDGINLYTGPFNGGPFLTAKESSDTTWTSFDSMKYSEGPFEMAFDSANGIVYSANSTAGVWALRVKR